MAMKKHRILILMHYMELGGAESALLGLLQSVDPGRADVDVFIYSHRGELMEYIPQDRVHLLDEIEAYSLTEKPIGEVVRRGYIRLALARLAGRWQTSEFMKKVKCGDKPYECATFFQQRQTWKVLPKINPDVEYDLAVSFMTPHFIVLNNVRARRKMGWIHTDYTRITIDVEEERKMWERLDGIVSISEEVGKCFCEVFPSVKGKIIEIENILNTRFMRKRAGEENVVLCEDADVKCLLTIGRFSAPKRLECIPEMCRRVSDAGVKIKWFVIGYGSEEIERVVKENIKKEGVEGSVVLLGKKDNPYPYINACDVYVQPSKYEGKSITVREAQILCKPVVITHYPTAASQVKDGRDGVIVSLDVADAACELAAFLNDEQRQQKIVSYLQEHDYGSEGEIGKFYNLAK